MNSSVTVPVGRSRTGTACPTNSVRSPLGRPAMRLAGFEPAALRSGGARLSLSYRREATSVPAVDLSYRAVTSSARRALPDLSLDGRRGRAARDRGARWRRRGLRRGRAPGSLRREHGLGRPLASRRRVTCSATTRSHSRRSVHASRRFQGRRRPRPGSTGRCTTSAGSSADSRSGGCSAFRAAPADLVHDLARDPDDMARRADASPDGRFRRLKLKLGGRDGLDVERGARFAARRRCPSWSTSTSTGRWTRRSTRYPSCRPSASSTWSSCCRRAIPAERF